ncbi:MAG TPA: DUF6285 domain-containing protein [Caulobacteraceae bacterium]|nr:DUF6285 domain-containing protein [Caulobacteraceae bacterium]
MQDQPTPSEILGAVAAFLKDEVAAGVQGALNFKVRVAANALEIARRNLDLAPPAEAVERERLAALLGQGEGSLFDLNAELCRRIEGGEVTLATPGLREHLFATTLAKLAVDQPTYSGYRALLAKQKP